MKTLETTIGRQRELVEVSHFIDKVEKDGAGLVVVGQLGVGKSHLLRAAARSAEARGMPVHASNGVRYEAGLQFAGLNQLLLPLRGEFAHLSAPQRDLLDDALGLGSGDIDDTAPVAEAVVALLGRLTKDGPVLVTIDDLHWLDPASWAVIAAVAQSIPGTRAGLLMSVCADSLADYDLTSLPIHELRPLENSAAIQLLTHKFPMIQSPSLESVIGESAGHPLMLTELPKSLELRGRPPNTSLHDILPLNGRLLDAFGPQLSTLPASTRRVLLMAALNMDRTEDRGPMNSLQLEASDLGCLAPAIDARLVEDEERSGLVVFRHPLVRTTIVAMSTSAERRDAHRALAGRAVEREAQLRHLAQVTLDPDEQLARELEQIASQCVRQGEGFAAVEVLRHSADLSPERSDRTRRLAQASYIGADLASNAIDAEWMLTEARKANRKGGASLREAVAEARVLLNVVGDVDAAHSKLVAAIRGHGEPGDPPDEQVLSALALLVDVCVYSGRPAFRKPLDAELARLGKTAPPLLTAQRDLLCLSDPQGPNRASSLAAEVAVLMRDADPPTIAQLAPAAVAAGHVSNVRSILWQVARSERSGWPTSLKVKALDALVSDSFAGGRWEESIFIAGEGTKFSDRHGYELASRCFQLDSARIAAARGRESEVQDVTAAVSSWAVPRGALMLQLKCHRLQALTALGRGDFERAYLHATAVAPSDRAPESAPLALEVTLDLVEAAVRTHRPEAAAYHLRSIRDAYTAALAPRYAMIAAAAAGIAGGDEEREPFERALAVDGVERWPFDLARVQLAYGERLRRMRERAASRTYLEAAEETFCRLGAAPWAARARIELDASAMTKGGGEAFGLGALTPQEQQVALLAASGLTNKSIAAQLLISPRTVGAHLNHIFPKLGITTRASLRDAMRSGPLAGVGAR